MQSRLDQSVTAHLSQISVHSSRSPSPRSFTLGRSPSPRQYLFVDRDLSPIGVPLRASTPYDAEDILDEQTSILRHLEERGDQHAINDYIAAVERYEDARNEYLDIQPYESHSPLFTPEQSVSPLNSPLPHFRSLVTEPIEKRDVDLRSIPRIYGLREDFSPVTTNLNKRPRSPTFESAPPGINPEKRTRFNGPEPFVNAHFPKNLALPDSSFSHAWKQARPDAKAFIKKAKQDV